MIPWEPSALIKRCWLWTAASIKFLLPLSMLVSLGEQCQ